MKMMKRLLILAILTLWCAPAYGIRCSNDIISTGDRDLEVKLKLKDCGEVISKDIIGKETTSSHNINSKQHIEITKEEQLIERWHIRVVEQGGKYCYPLIFRGGILTEIGSWTQCD